MTLGIERLFPPTFTSPIEHLLGLPEVREVVDDRDIGLRFTPPSQPGSTWLVEARDGEELVAFVPGPAETGSAENVAPEP
jgi:hypothetical protein